ncbi:site-2 protease family protein [Methanolobus profundi]|uniref:PDZ domain-containing protein n=1 Tax=Methanolobus profundi TaxID=487685 RepID=A0A1I4PZ37_9EURY|nr:site-2 protease family protein [Methanolobus profundi]SFM32673.1 PDZ domain-containing protein [Methanolobus profundi]
MDGTNIALTLFFLYWLAVIMLERKGILKKYNISTYGPVLMIRTTHGLKLLDKLAIPKKAWRVYADIGIRLMFIGMIAMFLVIILSDLAMLASIGDNSMPEPGKFNEARNIFLIPGVNEFIPLTWGIIALVVTLVVHEFSHAILCRVENIRVKSMGILLAVVPIGGFAEPDEEELFGKKEEEITYENDPYGDRRLGITINDDEPEKKVVKTDEKIATRTQRARILAAGVMANFVVALIAFTLLFGPVLGAMSPLGDTMIVDVAEDSPAYAAGIRENMVITQIDDTQIGNVNDMLEYLEGLDTGTMVTLHAASDRIISTYDVEVIDPDIEPSGISIQSIVEDSPASAAGLEAGTSIMYIDGSPIRSYTDFQSIMNTSVPGQEVTVEIGREDTEGTTSYNVTLAQHPDVETKGFLGVVTSYDGQVATSLGISVGEFPATAYLELFKSIPQMLKGLAGWIILLGLPIIGFAGEGFPGFSGTLAQFYEPVGWAEPFGIGVFWLANALLWIGWLNFYVGLFNCLPAVPLDGGHVFRDYMNAFLFRVTGNEEKAEHLSALVAATFAMLILMSFLFMIFGPYIVHGF